MDKSAVARPLEVGFLAGTLILMGIGGMAGGTTLFVAPSGALMQMPLSYIEGTIFHNVLVPGIILFLFVGLFPILTGIGLLRLPAGAGPGPSISAKAITGHGRPYGQPA